MLQCHDLLKIAHAEDGGFASVPGEADHGARGCINMLDYILFKDLVRHTGRLTISIEAFLLQIIAVAAVEVADSTNRLRKNLEFSRCLCH
jgi:hypothetical protein